MKYVNELNTIILIALLKEHNIKKIIVSPGTTNISFVISVQNDSWFEVYSAVDERSASFMACGLADASGEPVVLSCTGATASRNYLSGLTEAYYRKLPVLAVTSSQNNMKCESYSPQFVDRTRQFNDLVKFSLQAPVISNNEKNCYITQVNRAILELTHNGNGPVHINLEFCFTGNYINNLPKVRKIERICIDDCMQDIPKGKKIGVFIGSHLPFSKEEEDTIDEFCSMYNAIVICDQTSNYRGKYRFLANLSNQQEKILSTRYFDILIHIGSVSGAYIPLKAKEVWRVNEDGEVRDLFGVLTKVYQMEEYDFFDCYTKKGFVGVSTGLLDKAQLERNAIINKIPELPFSNLWVAQQIENSLPKDSVLHLAILNSLRAWNTFETGDSVMCYSNTGGFGIDGCLSSFIGAAKSNPNKQFFGVFGDLSFFYDINVITNKVPSNAHILLINNGVGTEFKNYSHIASIFGEGADKYIAAKGHNGYKSHDLIRNFSRHCDINYFCAFNKDDFNCVKNEWINKGNSIFEIFTSDIDESNALKQINSIVSEKKLLIKKVLKKTGLVKLIKRL